MSKTNPSHREEMTSMTRRLPLALAALIAVIATVALTGSSSASFTSRTSSTGTVSAAADWTPPTVAVTSPAPLVKGTATITATASDATSGVKTVTIQRATAGSSSWTTICADSTAPYSCSWVTTAVADGAYDLRATAVDQDGNTATSTTVRTVVDNLGPTVTMTDPGSPLKGTKTFAATATDAASGVDKVVIQAGTGTTWTDLCTLTSAPFSCSVDTTSLANGTYSVRAVATDKAGHTTTSTAIANRVVQNTISSVTLTPPSTHLRGNVTLTAQATSTGSITSVTFERSVAGADSWTNICTDTSSPYTCSFATTGVTDGTYDLRAVLTDSEGIKTSSAVVADRIVDNTAANGVDIQTTNGGKAGKIDKGDTVVYTYSEQMDLSSIYAGWSGSATSGTLRVKGGFFSTDVLEVSSPNGVRLGTVDLNADFALWLVDATSDVTITAKTVTTDGVARTVVTMEVLNASGLQVSSPANMVWDPSASALDLAGNPTRTAPVTESGPLDLDF